MNLVYRRLTYIVFILIFLIAAPAIVLYTQGYRYNFQKGRVQKTGILIASSIPKKAQIYLNGELVKNQETPARIEKLLPGDYEIKLAKDGYHDWQKKLPIYENATTFAEKVILWKNSLPIFFSNQKITDWQLSPDQKKIVGIDGDDKIVLLDLEKGEISTLIQLKNAKKINLYGWSNTSKKIIVKTETNFFVINIEERPKINPQTVSGNYQTIKWDTENDNLVYGLNQKGVWQIDLFSQKVKLLTNEPVDDFIAESGALYRWQNGTIKKPSAETVAANCDGCRIVAKKNNKIILLNDNSGDFSIVDLENKTKEIKNQAKAIDWLDNKTLLFYNDWEIWTYNFEKQEPELITRLGEPIVKALWHPAGRHLIFISDNKIQVVELDNRELRNFIELAKMEKINNLIIDPQGKNLYFEGKLLNQEGALKLNIQ